MGDKDVAERFGPKIKGTWTRAVSGGTAPSPSMIEWYHNNFGLEVIHIWGMTEINPLGTIARRVSRREDLLKSESELSKPADPGSRGPAGSAQSGLSRRPHQRPAGGRKGGGGAADSRTLCLQQILRRQRTAQIP